MKKPTKNQRRRQKIIARLRARERVRRKRKKYIRQGERYIAPAEIIKAPPSFDIVRGAAVHVGKFLRAVERRVLLEKAPVKLDFRQVSTFYPAGTIWLYSELDRIVKLSGVPKPITIMQPYSLRSHEVMKQIGIFDITKDKCSVIPSREDVVYWKSTKGFDQSGDKLAVLEVVTNRVNEKHAEQLELSGIWRGVSEAVANSVDHAYQHPRSDGFNGLPDTRWWMFTQLRNNVFTIAVCDLGCGYRATINHTLPETFLREVLAAFTGANKDVFAIKAAMAFGRSGTNQSERGKGSRDAMSVVQKHGRGELMMLSNTGLVHYSFDGGQQVSQSEASLGIDIRGTIVWWKLPLKESVHDHG